MTQVKINVPGNSFDFIRVSKETNFQEEATVLMYAKHLSETEFKFLEIEAVSNPNMHINCSVPAAHFRECDSVFILQHNIKTEDRFKADRNLYPIAILLREYFMHKTAFLHSDNTVLTMSEVKI